MTTKLNVPYYAQTSEFTCGPACVIMAMRHFEPTLRLDRNIEFEVWRECNMIGVRGADPYGLSVPLIDAGYEVKLITRRREVFDPTQWRRRLARRFSSEEIELTFLGMKQNRMRASHRGLKVRHKRPTVDDVVRGLSEGFVPIALVHMGVVHSLNIPHWVVVTNADRQTVHFNDPYPPKGHKGIHLSHLKFQKILDDIETKIGLTPSILLVRRKRAPASSRKRS